MQSCVLAYLLTCILQDRLDHASLGVSVNDALDQLARIQRVPTHVAGHQLLKTTRPNDQQATILDAIGAPLPPQHEAA